MKLSVPYPTAFTCYANMRLLHSYNDVDFEITEYRSATGITPVWMHDFVGIFDQWLVCIFVEVID